MPTMRESMKLRKMPGGEETGRVAPIGFLIKINDRDPPASDNPGFYKIQVMEANGQPEGWVAADSVNQQDSLTSIDKDRFAKECWRSAIDFGANAHYLAAVATLRSDITDGSIGTEIGPFRLLATEWAAGWGAAELELTLEPELIFDWRMQCAAFAVMAFRTITKLEAKLGRRPSSAELLLAQMAGTGVVVALELQSNVSLLALITQQAEGDLPLGQNRADILNRFAKWFKAGEEAVTGKVALGQVGADLQTAIDNTRLLVESTGAGVIANMFAGVQSTVPSAAKLDLHNLTAAQQAVAKQILVAFATAGFGPLQQVAALANAIAESALNPNAKSPPPEQSVGLFQLNMKNGLGVGRTEQSLKNAATNIAIIIESANRLEDFKNAASLRDAVDVFVRRIERPALKDAAVEKRLKIAESISATKDLLA